MKTKYTFTIPDDTNVEDLKPALRFLNISPTIRKHDLSDKITEFTADLTKYELLYLRLTLKKGVFKKLSEHQ